MNSEFKVWKQAGVAYFKVIFQNMPGKTGKNHEKSVRRADFHTAI